MTYQAEITDFVKKIPECMRIDLFDPSTRCIQFSLKLLSGRARLSPWSSSLAGSGFLYHQAGIIVND